MPDDISEASALSGRERDESLAGPDWKCVYCRTVQNQLSKKCINCGAEQIPPESTPAVGTTGKRIRTNNECIKPFIAAAVVIAIVTAISYFTFKTRTKSARVESVQWTYAVSIDRYQVLFRDGWSPDSDAFDVHNSGTRVHHYDHRVVGHHEVPYSDSYACGETCTTSPRTCSSNKNGTASCSGGSRTCSTKYCNRTLHRTVTDYADFPVYQDWYEWHAWDWAYNRLIQHSGVTTETSWPTEEELKPIILSLGERERQSRSEYYTVKFKSGTDTYEVKPKSLNEFQSYTIGQIVTLKVGLTSVQVLRPEIL
jgi:hypothetical protein